MKPIAVIYKQPDQRKPQTRFVEMPFRYASCHSERIVKSTYQQRKKAGKA